MRTCDAAVLVLRETDNPAVMWGDAGLLHMIANRAGLPSRSRSWQTEAAVLACLTRCPGALVPGYTTGHSGGRMRRVRIFWRPECVPR